MSERESIPDINDLSCTSQLQFDNLRTELERLQLEVTDFVNVFLPENPHLLQDTVDIETKSACCF